MNKNNVIKIKEKNINKAIIEKDNKISGMYIIKNENVYELYDKKIEIIDNGWIMSNKIPKVDIIKIGKYIEIN